MSTCLLPFRNTCFSLLAELWLTLASQFYVFLLFMSALYSLSPPGFFFLRAPFLPPCAAVCKCLGSVVRELTSWVLCPGGWPTHVDLLSLCHSHLGTCPGWDNMRDLIYSKESAPNQETAYLVKFGRPSKTQESWTLKCLSLCEFTFIEEFLANQSTSLCPCDHPIKYCYSCFILISSYNIFKIQLFYWNSFSFKSLDAKQSYYFWFLI